MKRKHIGLLLLIPIIIIAFLYTSKIQKDKWVKEASEIKYSKERENEVWGEILRGKNPALFYGTPLYDLAETLSGAIWFRNNEEIAKLIDALPKEYINFQEGKFGMTIGQFALETNNMFAIRKLLDKGLNPNLMDKSGNAIIIDINNSVYTNLPESLQTLKYMIKKGANVNLYSEKAQSGTPLIEASKRGKLVNVKLLVEAGANPHFIDELGYAFKTPLSAALSYKQIEVVNYLIFDQKVDFRTLKFPSTSKFHPGDYEILYNLREMFFELNSKKYQEKMRLVAYLKTQGLDYWKTPIEERFRNNPNYTPEYLSKY
ncbi:ankyrin repeat domain-containing protein [Flavobacterium cellulosilyticum]|uniref:Ankyrin repeat domain-containing protein n=1 Tax=Flavobacterium cellulosilyticum TaxID=2541731 RepID=A0A4R5CEQ6_9FLAO|nr:ankyrin repeat domain-containing protein [Flavobacterium cellulosilyticum]TDD98568.1 ankyrin repeat domain-containing protein [Flavobacterium cellulosilyticum]